MSIIEVTEIPLSPELIVDKVKTGGSGCVVNYVGLIRDESQGKPVLSVEYRDTADTASDVLSQIAGEAGEKWSVENIAISHRTGKLCVGDINLVVAVASAHRGEGFSVCQFIIDQFKERLPTEKTETYQDGTVFHQ